MPTLPPWLQISPEQFTSAAIAGGQQGYQAAGQAAELAQRGTLAVAQMAQEAAQRAAEIRLRREQINAELARNAANVAAARYNAALDFEQSQNALAFAREREANAVAQNQAQLAAQQQMTADELAVKRELGLARINTPESFAPSDIGRMMAEMNALPEGDPMRQVYMDRLRKVSTAAPKAAVLPPLDKAELGEIAKRQAELSVKQRSAIGLTESEVREREELMKRARQLQAITTPTATNSPALPAAPVGGPLRYQLINGQLQLVR